MSLISGDLGSKSVFPDGLQVDHLSENTVGHGVSVPGRTSGVAIEAGYVGERFPLTEASFTAIPAIYNAYKRLSTITVPKGVWLIYGRAELQAITGNTWVSGDNMRLALSTVDASDSGTVQSSSLVEAAVSGTVFQNGSVVVAMSILRHVSISSDTPYYLNAATYFGGTGTPIWRGCLYAVRIA